MSDNLGPMPPAYKPLHHYFQTAAEHDKRDPAIAYYCRLYGMQRGMELDKKSPDCRNYLVKLMNYLEQTKQQYKDLEAIQSEVVGQAYLENYCIKLFHYADTEDRASRFGKNVVKSFYTAAMLMDVLSNFGELPEEIEQNRKYAKWKAAYLHNCLKNGETPTPGPLDYENDKGLDNGTAANQSNIYNNQAPQIINNQPFQDPNSFNNTPSNPYNQFSNLPSVPPTGTISGAQSYIPTPQHNPTPTLPQSTYKPVENGSQNKLKSEDYAKAMKFCKFANSALQYEDSKTAIENLTKALNLLTTGRE